MSSTDKKAFKYKGTQKEPITNLVFKGGSVKGVAYVGAIAALRKLRGGEIYKNISNVAGTSAGAITALCVALDLSTEEILKALAETDIESFLDDSTTWLKKSYFTKSKLTTRNWVTGASRAYSDSRGGEIGFSTAKVKNWIENLILNSKIKDCIEKKGKNLTPKDIEKVVKNLTFKELEDLVNENAKNSTNFKNLFVVGFNLTEQFSQVFSCSTTGDNVVADAVVISMSLPFVFRSHRSVTKDSMSTDPSDFNLVESEDLWVDGGITNNYPIDIFDSSKESTVGFFLATEKLMKDILKDEVVKNEEFSNGVQGYAAGLLEAVTTYMQVKSHKTREDYKRTIYIDTKDVGTLDFGITIHAKNMLIKEGWTSTMNSFETDSDTTDYNDMENCPQLPIIEKPTPNEGWQSYCNII